jgi:hypothetical protein
VGGGGLGPGLILWLFLVLFRILFLFLGLVRILDGGTTDPGDLREGFPRLNIPWLELQGFLEERPGEHRLVLTERLLAKVDQLPGHRRGLGGSRQGAGEKQASRRQEPDSSPTRS